MSNERMTLEEFVSVALEAIVSDLTLTTRINA